MLACPVPPPENYSSACTNEASNSVQSINQSADSCTYVSYVTDYQTRHPYTSNRLPFQLKAVFLFHVRIPLILPDEFATRHLQTLIFQQSILFTRHDETIITQNIQWLSPADKPEIITSSKQFDEKQPIIWNGMYMQVQAVSNG